MFKRVVLPLLVLLLLAALYLFAVTRWSYSSGERAGWVQKLSNKGWVCKTWEGELSMVSMPGATPEKFAFTVTDNAVAERITKAMGKRVSLHYDQRVGLPGSCFGETRYYVDNISVSDEITLTPGVVVPTAPVAAPAAAPAAASASR
jgi:hypothetical protein